MATAARATVRSLPEQDGDPAPAGVCPIAHTLQVLGSSKWTGYVVRELLSGPKRFKDIRAGLGDINPKPLTDTLRVLEDNGLVTRTAYAEMPPRVVYELTARGHSLHPVLRAMADWGTRDLNGDP